MKFLDNTVKTGIIVLIILIGVFGFLSNTKSNTLVIYPLLKTTYNITSSNSNLISRSEAISIANANVPAFGEVRYDIVLIQNGQNPYYMVTLYGNDPALNDYGQTIVVSMIDAHTGQFLGTTV